MRALEWAKIMTELNMQENAETFLQSGPVLVLRPANLRDKLSPEYVINEFPATIGRHPTNNVELPFDSISRYHSRITCDHGKLRITDLHSSNGTFVNGSRVQMAVLNDQDSISFGDLDFSATIEKADESLTGTPMSSTHTSVHFIQKDDESVETVFHAEVPEDTSRETYLKKDITDYDQLKSAKRHLVCLYRLHEIFNSCTEEPRLLRRTLKVFFDVLPVDRGVILMRDERETAVFRPSAVKTKLEFTGAKIGISKTILQRCLKERVAVLTRDASLDDRFKGAESVQLNRMRSVMCVPLISQQRIFGFIHLDSSDAVRSFTEEDLTFLANAGVEIAVHLHNMRMVQERIIQERMAAIGQTITGMAHNVKNILVLSQGGVEMMEKRLRNKNYDQLDETWGVVRRGLDRINNLVQEMLDYSRARTIEHRRVNVNDMIEELQETVADELKKRGVVCELNLDETCPNVRLDADGLEKAICNLLVNAIEACPEGTGKILLKSVMREDGNIQISVEDNAGGIPKEILPRIFIPFFTTKGSKGSGLGLAMTKKIIEDMGGRLNVQTEEGTGTCFNIMLIVEPAGDSSAPSQ